MKFRELWPTFDRTMDRPTVEKLSHSETDNYRFLIGFFRFVGFFDFLN